MASLAFGLFICVAFTAALFIATKLLPGRKVAGQKLPNGSRLIYRLNGMALFVATHMVLFVGWRYFGLSLSPLLEHFWSIFWAANIVTLIWLVAMMRASKARIAQGRADGPVDPGTHVLARWWYGIELNPNFLDVDLKVFAYQPSLIGLGLINAAFAYAQYETLGHLTPEMILYQLFWWLYLFTHYVQEPGVLSMWDVIAERFGFMLLWGDLVVVPFFYSIGGWYLLDGQRHLSSAGMIALTAYFCLGLWIFREANAQKNRFKADPKAIIWGRPAKAIGGRLLVSGWWGLGRKINYTGELMVYSSFALCTGAQSLLPWLVPLWLCCLFPHRAWRDERRCAAKYGALWQEYRQVARFRMIPFIF